MDHKNFSKNVALGYFLVGFSITFLYFLGSSYILLMKKTTLYFYKEFFLIAAICFFISFIFYIIFLYSGVGNFKLLKIFVFRCFYGFSAGKGTMGILISCLNFLCNSDCSHRDAIYIISCVVIYFIFCGVCICRYKKYIKNKENRAIYYLYPTVYFLLGGIAELNFVF